MKNICFAACIAALFLACNKNEKLEVKHVSNMASTGKNLNVKIENSVDPICNMSVTEVVQDTAVYKGKVYGFCSSYCKDEFKNNPESHLK